MKTDFDSFWEWCTAGRSLPDGRRASVHGDRLVIDHGGKSSPYRLSKETTDKYFRQVQAQGTCSSGYLKKVMSVYDVALVHGGGLNAMHGIGGKGTEMHKFIERMALRNAVNASLQRIAIYLPAAKSADRRAYRETLKTWLKKLALRYYAWEYDGAKYCSEIIDLKTHLQVRHGAHLAKMTIGICQKPIALWLKYLWLSGDPSKKPVFATLDRGIMKQANVPNPPKWPDIDTLGEYRRIVDHIDQHARKQGYGSGAVWEAETWSDEAAEDDDASAE